MNSKQTKAISEIQKAVSLGLNNDYISILVIEVGQDSTSMLIQFDHPCGVETEYYDIAKFDSFKANPWLAVRLKYNLSKEQYLEWIATSGQVQCSANTKAGTRCKNYISGGIQLDADQFKDYQGDYCAIHGGLGSQDGKDKRWDEG